MIKTYDISKPNSRNDYITFIYIIYYIWSPSGKTCHESVLTYIGSSTIYICDSRNYERLRDYGEIVEKAVSKGGYLVLLTAKKKCCYTLGVAGISCSCLPPLLMDPCMISWQMFSASILMAA